MNKKRLFLIWLTDTMGYIVIAIALAWLTKDASEDFDFTGIVIQGILFGIAMTLLQYYKIRKGRKE